MWYDYRQNTTRTNKRCKSPGVVEEENLTNGQKSSHGVLLVLEAEEASATLLESSQMLRAAIQKALENAGLVDPHLSSKGHRGRKAEYMLLVLPELIGKIVDEKWWKESVVKKKKSWDTLNDGTITKRHPMYNMYMKVKNEQKDYW